MSKVSCFNYLDQNMLIFKYLYFNLVTSDKNNFILTTSPTCFILHITNLLLVYPESCEKGVPDLELYGVPPPCDETEELGVKGPAMEEGGVSVR